MHFVVTFSIRVARIMSQFHSYLPVLNRVIDQTFPKRVLEWGPGFSTQFLAEALPGAMILSIEHDPAWHAQQVQALRHPNVTIQLVRHSLPFGKSEGYASYPLRWLVERGLPTKYFDLIFIDGRSRCDCITTAALVTAPEGVVVVHDSERANYRRTFFLFESVEEYPGTTVLSKPILSASVGARH
jgi:predicted O-methyltransferase YrrM